MRAPRRPSVWFGLACLAAFLLVATLGQLWGSPTRLVTLSPEGPSLAHPFGTDNLGRDLLARTADGAWRSAVISLGAIGIALVIATPIGLVTGWYHRRRIDGVVMRAVEVTQALPAFVLVIVLLSVIGTGDTDLGVVTVGSELRIAACIGLGFVPFFTRLVRAATLVEARQDYVLGLRSVGVTTREILFGEILWNAAPALAGQTLLALAIAVFAEGGLSFLGLGVAPPTPTLGNLVADASSQLLDGPWWFATLPGLVLVLGILGCNLLGDAVGDRLLGADLRRGGHR